MQRRHHLGEQLVQAASQGDVQGLAQLLQAGADVTYITAEGDTVLNHSIRGGCMQCAQLLLEHGADVNAQGVMGSAALAVALRTGNEHIIPALVQAGADVTISDDEGLAPLQVACLVGTTHLLDLLLPPEASDDGSCSANSEEDLSLAEGCMADDMEGQTEQQEQRRRRRQQLGDECFASMLTAAACGSAACLERLLQYPPALEQYRAHAAVVASGRLGLEQVALLQERQRALLSAEVADNEPVLRSLCFLLQTASLPSHIAAALGRADCLELLLKADPGTAGDANLEGWTPLLYAASTGNEACIELLLEHGADLEARNRAGRTAAFLAAISGQPQALGTLIRAGAQVDSQEVSRLYSPLMAATARASRMDVAADPQCGRFVQCMALLLAAGADPNLASRDGSTPLHAAAESGSSTCLTILLESASADVDVPDGRGRTPLALAASRRHGACVMQLLGQGASVADGIANTVMECLASFGATLRVLLPLLAPHQLQALSRAPAFYQTAIGGPEDVLHSVAHAPSRGAVPAESALPAGSAAHAGDDAHAVPAAPEPQALPERLMEVLLEMAYEGTNDLLYNVRRSNQEQLSRRPAFALELLQAACPPTPRLHSLLATSPRMVSTVLLWQSTPPLLQYASLIMRCAMVPASDRERLASRVGHLLSAFHQLAALCRHAGLRFACCADPASGAARVAPLEGHPLSLYPYGDGGGDVMEGMGDAGAAEGAEGEEGMEVDRQGQVGEEEGAAEVAGAEVAEEAGAEMEAGMDSRGPKREGHPSEAFSLPCSEPCSEPVLAALLEEYSEAVELLVEQAKEGGALAGWHFLLDYPKAATLHTRQRLLQSLMLGARGSNGSQLKVVTRRREVLQRVCSAVDEQRGDAGATGGALWHGVQVAFEEENATGDGVRREWFELLAGELANPDTGLFESHNDGVSYQPTPHARMHSGEGAGFGYFELVGAILGVALMQGCTLPGFKLGGHVWRLVLGGSRGQVELEVELEAADPQLVQGLAQLRLLGDRVSELGLHFETHDALGGRIELVPGGSEVEVSAANLESYIAALSSYKLCSSIWEATAAMQRGLRSVVTAAVMGRMTRCFTADELNTLVAGQSHICPRQWEAHARYANCSPSAPLVAWFWEALASWEQQQLAALLAFVTGSSALPAGGFPSLRGFNGAHHPFTLAVVMAEGDGRLPRASTCFNTLYLPSYSCAEVLMQRLLLAISAEQAFDEGVITR